MAYNSYELGDLVTVTSNFTDSAGSAQDPTVVKIDVLTPAGVLTTYVYGTDAEVVKSSTGVYYVNINASIAGVWKYRWYSTGTGQAAAFSYFNVVEK